MKMYAVKNKNGEGFLNHASKRKKVFSKGMVGHAVHSPYPSLRPKSHIEKHFKKWIANTFDPEDYVIIEFTGVEVKDE